MESAGRQTGRAHEHESRRAFARSARQRRHAMLSRPALSTRSRPDYQKSDGECHADFGILSGGAVKRSRSEQNNLPTRSACVSYRFPLRTISTTARIASITSCGCSLCISWQLFVLVMLSSIGNKFRELLVR